MKYVTSSDKKADGCVFCMAYQDNPEHDRENFVVYRGEHMFVLMNIYPYNPGHLMVLPYAHIATLLEVPPEAQTEMIRLASYFTGILTQVMTPHGFNMGLNIGQAAGAGIDDHLHLHVVPRWNGDSNFISVVGETRVLPETVNDTYDRIVAVVQKQPPALK